MLQEDHNRQQAQDISVILEMGFSLDLAKLALHQAGNVEEAILFCLEQGMFLLFGLILSLDND